MRWKLITLFSIFSFTLSAQFQGVVFNADFTFAEGVYFTHESWIANKPDASWEEIAGEMVQLPEDYRVQIANFGLKNGLKLNEVYAISLDGFPYIFTKQDEDQNFYEFSGLRFRGRYAYYRFEDKESVTKTMFAYNPANGRPFRQAPVTRERLISHEVLLNVQSGETMMLNKANVSKILVDYSDLQEAVNRLSDDDKQLRTKLIQAVKIYNEREPLLLQRAE